MPRGSSFKNIYSDYRETNETSTINSVSSVRSVLASRLAKREYIASERNDRSTDHVYLNIKYDPNKYFILAKFFNRTRANDSLYENLCSGCGYGVYEARGKLCNFCQFVINGYLKDNGNVYENICDKCSEVYSGGNCSICSENNIGNRADNACLRKSKSTSKKLKKRLFHSLFGSLRIVKSFKAPATPSDKTKASIRKLEIVHNIDGYDNVFQTNETFDLSRICELKRLKSNTSDYHIYGKLRRSDDHLPTYECVKQKSKSDDDLISGTGSETIFRSTSVNSHGSVDNDLLPALAAYPHRVQNSVSDWMTSLRCEIHDYFSFGAPDTGICNPKGIPASFKTSLELIGGASSFMFYAKQVGYTTDAQLAATDVRLKSFYEESKTLDLTHQMVNEFKRNLMKKQQANPRMRRQGIHLKLDGDQSKQCNYRVDLVGAGCNCLSPPAQSQAITVTQTTDRENSRRVVTPQLNKRCCMYEKDSEFVSDILQAFELFLGRDTDTVVAEVSDVKSANRSEAVSSNSLEKVPQQNCDFYLPPLEINIEQIIRQLELSKSLDKIVIQYEIPLKVFLKAIDQSSYLASLKYSKLSKIFHRFQVFLATSKCNVQIQTCAVSSDCHPARSLTSKNITSRKYNSVRDTVHSNKDFLHQRDVENTTIMTVPTGTSTTNTKDDEGEPIYQPIWKFKTIGEVREDYISDEYNGDLLRTCDSSASVAGVDIDDHDEWEPDDEFTFTTNLDGRSTEPDTLSLNTAKSSSSGSTITGYASSISSMNIASTFSLTYHIYRNICIFYSPKEPTTRAVLYNYDRNRCSSYFARQSPIIPTGRGSKGSPLITTTSEDYYWRRPSDIIGDRYKLEKSSESWGRMFADSVQAWKYMLLDVNYLDDEEDMIVSESQILKTQAIKEMGNPPPTIPILQRFKSISSGNLDVPTEEDKKSITERVRNKLQRGVFKLQTKSPKENKKGRSMFKRNEATILYLEDGMKPKCPIFNAPLDHLEMNETSYTDVPRFVVDCIKYIEKKDCIQIDGLYRASGNKVAIDELKQQLTESYIYDPKLLISDDIHTLTSLLKLFFRELSSPLIPQNIYQRLASTKNLMEASAVESLKSAFMDMRNPNHATLKFLIKHLTTVAHYSNENRMPASNLAIVWGPCILSANQKEYDIARMNTLAKVLIENYDKIFADNERLVS